MSTRLHLAAAVAACVLGLARISAVALEIQDFPAIVQPGEAAVAGFSGIAPPSVQPAGGDPNAAIFIDPNGLSLRIIDLRSPGSLPQGQLLNVPKPFSLSAAQIGQVFAVALDNASPPNVYAGATSAYGLPIVTPGPSGLIHVKQGGPGAAFMPGLFGPGGTPGSIWKMDGVTGQVSLFANVMFNSIPNTGPGLGGLAFDPASGNLFAADRDTGMIHRFGADGSQRAVYDHGQQGRSAAGLPPVPYNPAKRLDITNPVFDSTNPATWAYAPPERRVFGLAVRDGRLYYAVAADLQIWSVSIANGTFGGDARIEITVPPGDGPTEISKITFDDQGRMLLAERPMPTGDFSMTALSQEGIGRVLRYARMPDGTWQPAPNEYAIGMPLRNRNANGGVAVGYSYTPNGLFSGSCGGFLWSTGEELLGVSPAVNGLQGNDLEAVRPANVPPQQSYFVDYDDRLDDSATRGYLGDIAVVRSPVCGLGFYFGRPMWWAGFGWWWHHRHPTPPQSCTPNGNPGSKCCPEDTAMDGTGQCASICPAGVDPNGTADNGIPNFVYCSEGIDPRHHHTGDIKCVDGSTPDSDPVLKNAECLSRSPAGNPAVCPVGSTKATYAQYLATTGQPPSGNPAADSLPMCVPSTQQVACNKNSQQVGPDGKCTALCPGGGTAYPQSQTPSPKQTGDNLCCPVNSVPNPITGGCCPPGSIVQPDGTCSGNPPPPGGCNPTCTRGTTPDPKTGQCCTPGISAAGSCSCPGGQLLIGGTCSSISFRGKDSRAPGSKFILNICPECPDRWKDANGRCCQPPNQLSSKGTCCMNSMTPQRDGTCGSTPPPPTCPKDNDGECCNPPNQLTNKGACCLNGSVPQPDGTCLAPRSNRTREIYTRPPVVTTPPHVYPKRPINNPRPLRTPRGTTNSPNSGTNIR